ncbi:WD repeat-containing protein 87-like [Oryzias latipes]|uniref:WD repeat-containing protein 87-like n=1 Tax=Oryzias latipes TaxID=8090 RepID=UPI000CE1A761|nr:WD repeat-containing protein 87-like [Oryzias latipes]
MVDPRNLCESVKGTVLWGTALPWNPQLQLHIVVLPQHFASELDLCNQQRNLRVEQEESEPPQIKEEDGRPEPPHIKEEHGEPEHRHIKEEHGELELRYIKEEPEKADPSQIKEEQLKEPEPLLTKEEQEKFCISQDEDQLYLKQETDTLMEIPTYEEDQSV